MRTLIVATVGEGSSSSPLIDRLLRSRDLEIADIVPPGDAEVRAQKLQPYLVVVAVPPVQPQTVVGVVQRLRGIGIGHCFVVGPATDPKLILKVIQGGADLFLDQDELDAELPAALDRLRARQTSADRPPQMVAVLSAAGGCGASTVAVNVAALLARAYGSVNLIDLNAGKADLAPLLDIKPQYSLADVCRNDGRLDRGMYEKMLVRHPCGVALLAAPGSFDDVPSVTPQGVQRAVAVARESFTDVVVDLADGFRDEPLAVITDATRVLVVCRLDFTAVRNTRRILDYLQALDVPRDRVEVVVNHFGRPHDLPIAEAEEAIGRKIAHFVPHDAAAASAASNVGTPVALTAPTSAVAQSLARLVGLAAPAPPRPNHLVRLTTWFRTVAVPHVRSWKNRMMTRTDPLPTPEPEEVKTHHESVHAPEPCPATRSLSA